MKMHEIPSPMQRMKTFISLVVAGTCAFSLVGIVAAEDTDTSGSPNVVRPRRVRNVIRNRREQDGGLYRPRVENIRSNVKTRRGQFRERAKNNEHNIRDEATGRITGNCGDKTGLERARCVRKGLGVAKDKRQENRQDLQILDREAEGCDEYKGRDKLSCLRKARNKLRTESGEKNLGSTRRKLRSHRIHGKIRNTLDTECSDVTADEDREECLRDARKSLRDERQEERRSVVREHVESHCNTLEGYDQSVCERRARKVSRTRGRLQSLGADAHEEIKESCGGLHGRERFQCVRELRRINREGGGAVDEDTEEEATEE